MMKSLTSFAKPSPPCTIRPTIQLLPMILCHCHYGFKTSSRQMLNGALQALSRGLQRWHGSWFRHRWQRNLWFRMGTSITAMFLISRAVDVRLIRRAC